MARKLKTTQQYVITVELKDWLKRYAKEHHVSMSRVIVREIRRLKRREEARQNEISQFEHAEEFKLYA